MYIKKFDTLLSLLSCEQYIIQAALCCFQWKLLLVFAFRWIWFCCGTRGLDLNNWSLLRNAHRHML